MPEKERLTAREQALAQMLKPVRNVPFSVVILALTQQRFRVIPINQGDAADKDLLTRLGRAIELAAGDIKSNPIRRPRPNEVGNDVETYIMRALPRAGLDAERPTSPAGLEKSTGYPDILVTDKHRRATYLECKSFAYASADTTMRSFYLSPSDSFKVSIDARHLLLAFGMEATPISGSRDSSYAPRSYKLIDLHDLRCDVKYEFNSDNRRLYASPMVLLEANL